MKTFNIQDAKTQLSKLIEQVVTEGEDIVIAKAGKPMVRLVAFREQGAPRVGGQYRGQIIERDGCWDSEESEFLDSASAELYEPDEPTETPMIMVAER